MNQAQSTQLNAINEHSAAQKQMKPGSGGHAEISVNEHSRDLASEHYGIFSVSEKETFTCQLDVAKAISTMIREDLYNKQNFKSGNKIHQWVNDENAEQVRLDEAEAEITKLRQHPESERAIHALHARGHNCGELAAIVKLIAHRNGMEAHVIGTKSHEFAVLGDVAKLQGKLPKDISTWPSDLVICDVWSNIVCMANEYPHHFLGKMEKWKMEGKEVYHIQDGEGDWTSPLDESWINSVLRTRKRIVETA
jgi:hypothetical protein